MPKSKFSVGQQVKLSHAGTVWTVKEVSFVGEQCYVKAIREGHADGSYYEQNVEYFEERFESI